MMIKKSVFTWSLLSIQTFDSAASKCVEVKLPAHRAEHPADLPVKPYFATSLIVVAISL
jgi:hypothetical protein